MDFRKALKFVLPYDVVKILRDMPYLIDDIFHRPPAHTWAVPARRLMYEGPRGRNVFIKNGLSALEFYSEVLGVDPDCSILDIGSGIGRKSLPLLSYLSDTGRYVGIDTNNVGIEWCKKHIGKHDIRFKFFYVDIQNSLYNPNGKLDPEKLELPFNSQSFDFVVLWSVFTHMKPAAIAQYLKEIARVLKPMGSCLFTCFTLSTLPQSRTSVIYFNTEFRDFFSTNSRMVEECIGIKPDWIEIALDSVGLKIDRLLRGKWRSASKGDAGSVRFQDLVIVKQKASYADQV